jgi:hypothetical protein
MNTERERIRQRHGAEGSPKTVSSTVFDAENAYKSKKEGSVETETAPTTPTKGLKEQYPTRRSPYGEREPSNCLFESRASRPRLVVLWEANT